MSQYILTEAYSELYNPRLTTPQYYDNLRFVDNLTQPQIQEVMESLIWEFMDYGDTLDEAVNTLQEVFRVDSEILSESLDFLCEGRAGERRMAQRKETRERQRLEAQKTTSEREANLKTFAKRDAAAAKERPAISSRADTTRRGRAAVRSSMIRVALSGAKKNVTGALKGLQKKVTDARSKLAAKGSSVALRAQAALSKVGRMGRGAVKGAIAGARSEYNTPSKAPSSRIPGRQQTQQLRAAARKEMGDVFSKPSKPSTSKIELLRAAAKASKARVPKEGRTIHGGPAPKPPGLPKSNTETSKQLSLFNKKGKPINPTKPLSGAAAQTRFRLAEPAQATRPKPEKPKKGYKTSPGQISLNLNKEDIDFDTLTQYMIEDLINEGYVDTEEDALFILDNMNEETLTELAEAYLED